MADETIPDIITDPSGFDADGEFWLKAAQAAIRRTCGWHITPNIELSGVANSRGGKVIRLPARHVTSVDELTDSAGNRLHYAYDPTTGLVECTTGAFPAGVAAIRYRIHAGYTPDEVPDVQGVLINAAKRASSAAAGIVQSQSVNGSSVTYNVSLMADELAKLDRYKLGSIAVSIIDDINASGLPAATRFVRLRASRKPDPYNPAQTTEDWTKPVELEVRGALASSSSTRTPDVLDVQTTSTAVLTVADPNADIRLGDRIRPEPADGRMWEVSGFPSRDANAFTGWQPTLEVQLTEWKG